DQARRRHLLAVQAKPDLGQRPGFLSTASRLDRTHAGGPQLESLGEGPGDDEKRGAGVHKKLDRLVLARGAGQVSRNAAETHGRHSAPRHGPQTMSMYTALRKDEAIRLRSSSSPGDAPTRWRSAPRSSGLCGR